MRRDLAGIEKIGKGPIVREIDYFETKGRRKEVSDSRGLQSPAAVSQ